MKQKRMTSDDQKIIEGLRAAGELAKWAANALYKLGVAANAAADHYERKFK